MSFKKIAILQSNYIPWKGYFDLINMADEFILFDDAQYTREDWRNRNKIKTPNGIQWLTIPVYTKGKLTQKISEASISNKNWARKHWQSIMQNYSQAKYFETYQYIFKDLYENIQSNKLGDINFSFIKAITGILNINTTISFSSDYELIEGKTERLIHLCKQAQADYYITGPAAKSYLQEDLFNRNKIKLEWMDYSGYKEYNQLYPPFEHNVSIIDLIFNEGPNSTQYMKSFGSN